MIGEILKKKSLAMILEIIAGIFGWAWLIGIPIWIYFLVQWIRGVHPWWYFAIAIAATGLFKALAREYKKESIKAIDESAEKDLTQEWIDLPENEKK
jgi:hypothetical protein